ncbi:hypothetical protein WG915_03540 [Corynebacterium sp. H128]|uniref:hypothetical protein n=1 Tax=unclassified Corynebacterium TaxID=2624378 RepID=UPI0030B2565A
MDINIIKDQLGDFGTFVENSLKIFENLGPAMNNAANLLFADTWTSFFGMFADNAEFLSNDTDTSAAISN